MKIPNLLLLAFLAAFAALPASAATSFNATESVVGDFETDGTWDKAGSPVNGDNVYVASNATVTLNNATADYTLNALRVGFKSSGAGNGTLNILNGAISGTFDGCVGQLAGYSGTLTVGGAGSTGAAYSANRVFVGYTAGATGILNIGQNGTVTSDNEVRFAQSASMVSELNMSGNGRLIAKGAVFNAGNQGGSATLNLRDTSLIDASGTLTFGNTTGATSSINLHDNAQIKANALTVRATGVVTWFVNSPNFTANITIGTGQTALNAGYVFRIDLSNFHADVNGDFSSPILKTGGTTTTPTFEYYFGEGKTAADLGISGLTDVGDLWDSVAQEATLAFHYIATPVPEPATTAALLALVTLAALVRVHTKGAKGTTKGTKSPIL